MKPVSSIAIGLLVGPAVAMSVMAAASQAASATTTPATANTQFAHDWDGSNYADPYRNHTSDPRWGHRWDPRWNWRHHHHHHHHWDPRGGWHR